MNEPFVSKYDEIFNKAIVTSIEKMPKEIFKYVENFVNEIHQNVIDKLMDFIRDEMKNDLDLEIKAVAGEIASSMLANALAGDSDEIRNLFGFNEWYMKYAYHGKLPTQWALIDAIVVKNPQVFIDERIKQRDLEIHKLNRIVSDLNYKINQLNEREI